MKLEEFENEELFQLIDNFNHYSVLIKSYKILNNKISNNNLLGEIKIEDVHSELLKRGIEKKDNTYYVTLEQITLLEKNNVSQKENYNQILGITKNNSQPKAKLTEQIKAENDKTSIKLNFNQKYFSLYQIDGNSLIDLKINNGDIILVKNLPAKIKSKLKKIKSKFSLETNNSNLFDEWISILEAYNSKLIVFILKDKMFVKELNIIDNTVYLMSKNNKYFNYKLSPETNFELLGIVTNVIRNLD